MSVSVKDIRLKFKAMVDFKQLKQTHQLELINNDLLASREVGDIGHEHEDEGLSDYPSRVGKGTANRSSKTWGTVFRVYNALARVKASNLNILDLGCDDGWLRRAINSGTYHSGTNYIGLDIKSGGLVQSSEGMSKSNNAAVYIVDDIRNSFKYIKDMSVDIVYAMEIFEHVEPENAGEFLDRMKQVVSKDGIIFLSMPNPGNGNYHIPKKYQATGGFPFHHKEYPITEFIAMVEKHDLLLIDVFGWFISPKVLKDNMNAKDRRVYNRLVQIMGGSQIPSQVIGMMYPHVANEVVYILKRK